MSEHELWNEIGNLYFLSGAYKPAIQAYTKAIEMDDKFGRPYSNLALVHVQQGQYERAIELYHRSIDLLSDSEEKAISWIRLGNVYRQLKDYHMAVTAYQEADRLNPSINVDHDQPGQEKDVLLMISVPALNLASTTSGQVSSEVESTTASLVGQQDSAPTKVVLPPKELAQAVTVNSNVAEAPWLDQLSPIEEPGDLDGTTFQSEEDIFKDLLDNNIIQHDNNYSPIVSKDQESRYQDLDNTENLPEQMDHEEKPTLLDDSQEPETGIIKTMNVSISGELPCKKSEMATAQPVEEVVPNSQKETDLDNLSSVLDRENELTLNFTNGWEFNATIPNLALPADILPSAIVGKEQHKADSTFFPEAKHNAEETEINKLKKAVDLNPHDAMAWDALGSLYKTNGQYQYAIFAYEQAISIETNNASFHYHLGLVYAAENRNENALRLLKKVIDLDPNYGLAHATLSGYYRQMGLEELARQHINKALNNTFQNESEYNRACLESICGNADRALEYLELALQKQHSYADWALHDLDLDFVRNDSRFMTLITKYTTKIIIDNENSKVLGVSASK